MAPSTTSRQTAHRARPFLFLFTLIVTCALLGFCSKQANATIYYVSTTGSNFNTGLSWSSPKSNLQSVITAAHSGDQVWVEKGTYTNASNFTATDGMAIYGGFAGTETSISQRNITANPTILNDDSNGAYPVYTVPNAATGTNTLDGFTVENGADGGLYDGSSTDTLDVMNCLFSGNSSGGGSGIDDFSTTANVINCTFTSNNSTTGEGIGGGISAQGTTATISNCTFTDNSANGYNGGGGGIYAYSTTVIVTSCTFTGNHATEEGGNSGGGGVFVIGTMASISNCTFTDNTGSIGGGVLAESATTISNCKFAGNRASISGGGVSSNNASTVEDCTFGSLNASDANTPAAITLGDSVSTTPTIIKNCLIIGSGTTTAAPDGIDVYTSRSGYSSYATVANNTIVNVNVGINLTTSNGAISIANNIFYGDYGSLNTTGSPGPTFTSSHNDNDNNVSYYYQGVNPSSTDLLSVDPMFVNAGSGNYHLSSSSPLINAGNDSYVMSGDTDLDGHARIQGSHVDIGCYETSAAATATLTSISPGSVQAGDYSFTLTVTGTGFVSGGTVEWNGTALSTQYVSATQLTVTVPASLVATAGTASVTELNSGASASNAKTFTITAAATLTSLSPTSKPADSPTFTLTVNGTNFLPGAVVYWNTAGLTTTEVSSTELTAIVPASDLTTVGTVMISAANPHTAGTNALTFTVTTPVAAITSLSPSSIAAGSAEFILSVNGSNFVSGSVVKWNGAALQTAYFNGTILAALVPASDVATAGTASITVANPGVAASNALTFTITGTTAVPTITGFTPTAGPVGTSVTITGTNFTGATSVKFGGTATTAFTVNSATRITATVPTGAATGAISVTTPGGTATSANNFTVTMTSGVPTITGFTPTSGPVGTTVVITGTNFTGATVVGFTGAHASFTVNSSTQITATVPTGAMTGTIAVATPGGTAHSTASFTVTTTTGPPTITGFTPASGPVGTSVVITGTNFTGATVVGFTGAHASFTVNSSTQITATVPTGAMTGPIAVATPGGTVKSTTSFTVTP